VSYSSFNKNMNITQKSSSSSGSLHFRIGQAIFIHRSVLGPSPKDDFLVRCTDDYYEEEGVVVDYYKPNQPIPENKMNRYFYKEMAIQNQDLLKMLQQTRHGRIIAQVDDRFDVIPESWWSVNIDKKNKAPVAGYVEFMSNTEYYMRKILRRD